jgi:hypothetical protein
VTVFKSKVVIVFLSNFYFKMHENNILLFFKKIIFDISTSKQFEKIKKILI